MNSDSEVKKVSQGNNSADYKIAYYQQEMTWLWLAYGHEPDEKEPTVMSWRSLEDDI